MKSLFVDNFRGFSNTFMSIKDINFFVGENSTGKTSLLSLMSVISSMMFWITQDFNIADVALGSFEDIVSIEAENRKYFKIGIIEYPDDLTTKNLRDINVYLLEYVRESGLPIISRFNYIDNDNEVKVIFSKKSINYKIKQIHFGNDICKNILNIYKDWVLTNGSTKGFRKLKSQIPFDRKEVLPFIHGLINQEVSKKKDSKPKEIMFMTPKFLRNLRSIAPIRSKPQRTYDRLKMDFTPEGSHAPYLIRRILRGKKGSVSFKKFIKFFGKKSNLFNSISIKEFGKFAESPFELDVTLNKNPLSINKVGYGVSQCLPIVVELFTGSKGSVFAIQQPEIHLHPKAHAALGDIIYYFAEKENKKFFIETHSDYIIDRFRINLRKNKPSKNKSQVLFFERTPDGNKVSSIDINTNGEYSDQQPRSFKEFFIKEEMILLGLE